MRGVPLALTLDRSASRPLHVQLADELRRVIRDRTLPPGAQLPSVQWLCRTYALSTTTVSRVLRELKNEGAITTIRGGGCSVNPPPEPVTEVIIAAEDSFRLTLRSFYYELIVGMKEGYADPARRFVLTHYDERLPVKEELAALMRLRRADGLVVHRPGKAMAAALRDLTCRHRVVSLFTQPADGAGACVLADPGESLRRLLRERLAAGKRQFVLLGKTSLLRDAQSPYSRLGIAFRETMRAAGLQARELLLDDQRDGQSVYTIDEANRLLADRATDVSAGAVVVAVTPHIARAVYRPDRALDLISYTESSSSLAELGGLMTLLYVSLERVGAAAAALLRDPAADQSRVTALTPEVIPPGRGVTRERSTA